MEAKAKRLARERRHTRVRRKVRGEADRPRLAVFRSSRHIYVQLIDDRGARTLAAASDAEVGGGNPTERAKAVGTLIATRAKDAGIASVVFDRGGFRFHGRVAALAEGAREGGLQI